MAVDTMILNNHILKFKKEANWNGEDSIRTMNIWDKS